MCVSRLHCWFIVGQYPCVILANYCKELAILFLSLFLTLSFVVRKFQELTTAVIFGKNSGVMVITVNTGV